MNRDQAAILRAMVQGQGVEIENLAKKEKNFKSIQSTFEPLSLEKPLQILKPKLEIVVDSIATEDLRCDLIEVQEVLDNQGINNTEQRFEPIKNQELEESMEVLNKNRDSNEGILKESEVNSELISKDSHEKEELNFQEIQPLAKAEEGVRILAVCSGKGGVGKTNVVLNLAIALKRQGKNPLIIDTDFGFTNIDVLCGVVAPYSLQDVLKGEKELKEIVIEGPEGVKIIPGGNDVIHLNDMSSDHKKVFQEQFSQLEGVDVLLIDMGAGVSKTSLLYTMFAQEVLLVVTPEPTSLTDAYSLLKMMELSHFEQQVKVIVNRVINEEESIRTFKKLEATVSNFLKRITLEYVSCIHDDPVVSGSVKAQIPFLIKHPESAPAKDILKLVDRLFALQQPKKLFKNMQQVLGRLMRVFG